MIDPTDFVLSDTGSLRFSAERQQAKFELGVCMAVHKWEELATAVENSWGGPNSADKRDWLSGVVIDLFNEKAVDVILIEETLLYAMVDEFDTEIDNDLALEIAALVLGLYRECAAENYATVDAMYARFQQRQLRAHKVVVGGDPNNPSEESESDDDAMDVDVERPVRERVVDDDGFELVQRRR